MISKILTMSAGALTLSVAGAFAQATTDTTEGADFGTWDTDQSGDISQEEFDTGTFGAADQDTDTMLDETEYGTTGLTESFDELDQDGDGMISQDEWLQARAGATGEGTFGSFDTDASGGLDETELESYGAQAGGTGAATTGAATGTDTGAGTDADVDTDTDTD